MKESTTIVLNDFKFDKNDMPFLENQFFNKFHSNRVKPFFDEVRYFVKTLSLNRNIRTRLGLCSNPRFDMGPTEVYGIYAGDRPIMNLTLRESLTKSFLVNESFTGKEVAEQLYKWGQSHKEIKGFSLPHYVASDETASYDSGALITFLKDLVIHLGPDVSWSQKIGGFNESFVLVATVNALESLWIEVHTHAREELPDAFEQECIFFPKK